MEQENKDLSLNQNIEAENLNPELNEVLGQLNPEQREIIIQNIHSSLSFSGPLPHPGILEGYDKVQPGIAERIVAMAEKQLDSSIFCEKEPIKATRRGQWMGFTVAILFLVAAFTLGILGHDWLAATIGGGTLVALVTIFVTNRPPRQPQK